MNHLNKILNIFKTKYDQDKLAHLYLIRYEPAQINFEELSSRFIESLLNKKIDNHPDILKVTIDKDEKIYKVDSDHFLRLINFLNYSPINLKHKFAFVADSHLISDILYNKMLKTFEELNPHISIFLFIPKEEQILATIKSRSIEIYINAEQSNEINLNNDHLDFNQLKKSQYTLNEIITAISSQKMNYEEYDALLNSIKNVNELEIFNTSRNTKLATLLP